MAKHPNRRPVEMEMVGGKGSRQRIWETIRTLRDGFTRYTLSRRAKVDDATARTYLLSLEKGGFIAQANDAGRCEEKHYRLVKDCGLEAPRLNRAGEPVTQGRGQEQMWRTMRILGADFTYLELAGFASTADAEVSPTAARDYLKHLAKAGYVLVVSKGQGRGKGGIPSRYRLAPGKYTGPRPPMVQRTKALYDPNLGKVVWHEEINDDDL
ncbi:hypothetical protein PCA31118_00040 [Pandoraea captiosa]|uniref:Uncharacterized protein n=1 Tax=Pandoraea captiosa TaxID=2508302 RepID=A0A5E4ZEQ8_9BURK|nr:hypothetical protein [Pandoraea captiosa]VVE59861.1 hypothetical protein PCA31118_00040 [Pandoraea captiosa]